MSSLSRIATALAVRGPPEITAISPITSPWRISARRWRPVPGRST
jgi:hypothetical protein